MAAESDANGTTVPVAAVLPVFGVTAQRWRRADLEESDRQPPVGGAVSADGFWEASVAAQPVEQVPLTIEQIAFGGYPDRPVEFVHDLHLGDDRLNIASIADLADRLPRQSVIYDTAALPLLDPEGGMPRGALDRPGDVIRNLKSANAWITLLNAEVDPVYAELMWSHMLDQLEPGMIATGSWPSMARSAIGRHSSLSHPRIRSRRSTSTLSTTC